MKWNQSLLLATTLAVGAATSLNAGAKAPSIEGRYLEARSCDVYTGPCFANGEMGLTGKEGILFWDVRQGEWNGVDLKGLKVLAVVATDQTLGDQKYQPRQGKAVLIVDETADNVQRQALEEFVRSISGELIKSVARVEAAPIESRFDQCSNSSCASVKAGDWVEVSTRCLGDKDHLCGNEETYYPPLTPVENPRAAFTQVAAFQGEGLNRTWENRGQRSAFLAGFSR